MKLPWGTNKVVAMVFLGVEAVARDVKAMMPGRAVRVVEVKPTSGQAGGGVPVMPKASTDKGAAAASSPKSNHASLFTTVATQSLLGAGVRLATDSAIAGGLAVLLGAAGVDAAEVPMDVTMKDDERSCGAFTTAAKWLFLSASSAWAVVLTTFMVLSSIKTFDETAQYVYRHALYYWQGLYGMLDFMLAL